MRKKIALFILGTVLIIYSNVAFAGMSVIGGEDHILTSIGRGGKLSYNEQGQNILITMKSINERVDQLTVYKDNNIIYSTRMNHAHREIYTVHWIHDIKTNRYFYILNSGDTAWLMGFDREMNKWQVYADCKNYRNTVNGKAKIDVQNYELYLTFLNDRGNAQMYHLFWDSDSNWFGYDDLGIR